MGKKSFIVLLTLSILSFAQSFQGVLSGQLIAFYSYNSSLSTPVPNEPWFALEGVDFSGFEEEWTIEFWVNVPASSTPSDVPTLHFYQDQDNWFIITTQIRGTACGDACVGIAMSQDGVITRVFANSIPTDRRWSKISVGYRRQAGGEIRVLTIGLSAGQIEQTVTPFNFEINLHQFVAGSIGWVTPVNPAFDMNFIGAIDDIQIWDHFRTTAQVVEQLGWSIQGNEQGLHTYISFDTGNNNFTSTVGTMIARLGNPNTPVPIFLQDVSSVSASSRNGGSPGLNDLRRRITYNSFTSATLAASRGPSDTSSNLLTKLPYGAKICTSSNAGCPALAIGSLTPSNNRLFFHAQRGSCGSTQTAEFLPRRDDPPINTTNVVTYTITVEALTPVLSIMNYTSPSTGTTINIQGSNFGLDGLLDPVEEVYAMFGTSRVNCTSAQVLQSGTRINCVIPAGIGGNGRITVRTCRQTASFSPYFSYEPPTVTEALFSTTDGNETIIAIYGNNFGPSRTFNGVTDSILINGTSCARRENNHTFISCSTLRVMQNGLVYPVTLSIGGQSISFLFNYTLCNPPCLNGGLCTDRDQCDCTRTPFDGDYCEEPLVCAPPCLNSGVCFRRSGSLTETVCVCSGDWTGIDCAQSTIVQLTGNDDPSLTIGLGAGAGAIVLILVIVVVILWRRKPVRGGKNFIPVEKKDFTKIIFGDQLNQVADKSSGNISELERFLLEDNLKLAFAVSTITQITEADKIAKALIIIFQDNNKVLSLLQAFIDEEVKTTETAGTLFRSNSMVSKMFKFYSRLIGLPYLYITVGPELTELIEAELGLEVDPEKMEEGTDLDEMRWMLMAQSQKILKQILNSSESCPVQFRSLFSHIKYIVNQRFPENVNTTIGGFIFLRFFCPAISSPEAYGIFDEPPSPQSRRLLILITKVLQNLSNDVEFGSKEPYMAKMNDFIQSNRAKLIEFYEKLVKPTSKQATDTPLPPNIKNVSLSVISQHIKQNIDQFSDTELRKRLEGIVN